MSTEKKRAYDHARYLRLKFDPKRRALAAKASKRYYKKHRAKMAARQRARYAANPARGYEIQRRWVLKNVAARRLYMRKWRAKNRKARKTYDHNYRVTHLDQRAHKQNVRRARELGNGGSHTFAQWEALKIAYGGRCGYCGTRVARLTKDHANPLSRGGRDDIGNIVPACFRCNRRKHSRTADEFAEILSLEYLVSL